MRDNNTDETMQITAIGAEEMGMVPYYLYRQKNMSCNFENVGYTGKGKFRIYNILIMEEKKIIKDVSGKNRDVLFYTKSFENSQKSRKMYLLSK